jgi:hypothetical protein
MNTLYSHKEGKKERRERERESYTNDACVTIAALFEHPILDLFFNLPAFRLLAWWQNWMT